MKIFLYFYLSIAGYNQLLHLNDFECLKRKENIREQFDEEIFNTTELV